MSLAASQFPTLAQICQSPDDFLGRLDIGALNLLCAVGLPGAEDLDVAKQLDWLDEAARQVDLQTRSRFDEFKANPDAFDNSPGKFCCNYLLQTLQVLHGVQYNPARISDADFQSPLCINPDFRDSRDLFIHGMMGGPGGTCASMPVMYVAVGRRLGYPLKLVATSGHLFIRWDDLEGRCFNVPERFNIEGAGSGMSFYPDDFYRTWPCEWQPYDEAGGWFLKSLSPVEELGCFLGIRGSSLEDNGCLGEAIRVFEWAAKLLPHDLRYRSQLVKLMQREVEDAARTLEGERRALELQRTIVEQRANRLERAQLIAPVSRPPNVPPHGAYCQCLQCSQARSQARSNFHRPPGHAMNCGCPTCKPNWARPW